MTDWVHNYWFCVETSNQTPRTQHISLSFEATNVSLSDGISRHMLTPYNIHSLKYNSRSHSRPTIQFTVPVQTQMRLSYLT